jgi:hypothetical protein
MEKQMRTIEATIDTHGGVHLQEPLELSAPRRALVTILDEVPSSTKDVTVLSEAALADDWNRPEEDEAWFHLQPAQ